MKMRDFLGISKRTGKVTNTDRAKIRHDHGVLIAANKPRFLTAKCICGKYEICLSTFYSIVK